MTDHLTAENKERLYVYSSVALTLPVVIWPFVYQFTFFLDDYFHFSWVVSAGLALLIAVIADSIFSGMASVRSTAVMLAWIFLVLLSVAVALNLWNGIYLLAIMWFLHSLRSCMDLWIGKRRWWSWVAWTRDCLISLALFLWLPLLSQF